MNSSTRGHHHSSSNSIERVRGKTSTSGDTPTEEEGGEEVALKRTDKDDRLDRVVQTEVETSVDNDTNDGRNETSVETSDTIGSEGLSVDID